MARNSRSKHHGTPAPVSRVPRSTLGLYNSTWLFVGGVVALSYGTAAVQYSRWNHAENAHVHPVFHPWAILLGVALIVLSYRKPKGDK
ncbi:MAG TPA: hypothetical protein VG225_03635 [Terracidiphilus sp.]|jgi:hypothetical protein|nr:hypothetical protein [Terracidiphilus sp.]